MTDKINFNVSQSKLPRAVYLKYLQLEAEQKLNRRVAGKKKFTMRDFLAKCVEKFNADPDKFLKHIDYDKD